MKKYRIIVVLFSVLLAFGISIVFDRFLGTYLNTHGWFFAMMPRLTELHETREYSYVATISAQGLRNEEVVMPKPKGEYRILAIGDSFTFGEGVDVQQTWVKQTEQGLQEKGYPVKIIDAGKPGASPITDRQICSAYKSQLDVDAIIYGMYIDDLGQAAYRENQLNEQPLQKISYINLWPTLHRISQRIIDYTRWPEAKSGDTVKSMEYAAYDVQLLLKKNPTILLSVDPKFRDDFLKGNINPSIVLNGIRVPETFTYILDEKQLDFALTSFATRMERLRDWCANDIPLIVVFIPSSDMVSSYYFPFKEELRYTMDPHLVSVDIDKKIAPIMEREHFYFFSVLSDLRRANCTTCYYPYDGHMTPVGHMLVAQDLVPFMERVLDTQKIQGKK